MRHTLRSYLLSGAALLWLAPLWGCGEAGSPGAQASQALNPDLGGDVEAEPALDLEEVGQEEPDLADSPDLPLRPPPGFRAKFAPLELDPRLAPPQEWTTLVAASNGGETHWRCRPSQVSQGSDRRGWDCVDPSRENGGETHWACRPDVANGGETHWACFQTNVANGGETHWLCTPGDSWSCQALVWDRLSVGLGAACGLRDGGAVACWGSDALRAGAPSRDRLGLTAIALGQQAACALDAGGVPLCWSSLASPITQSPQVPLSAVTVGGQHACGLLSDGGALCWGDDGAGQASPPAIPFVALSAGARHTCGLSLAGEAICWGGDDSLRQAAPQEAGLKAISSGAQHACALRQDGGALCWGGDNALGELDAPEGAWAALSAGAHHGCALDAQGRAVCWGGSEAARQAPVVALQSLSAGLDQTCGLAVGGEAHCWGESFDEEQPPRCGDGQLGLPNACGGCRELNDGQAGDPCSGRCPGATLQCAGPEEVICVDVALPNECGGCAPLAAEVDDACGHCGGGVVGCASDDVASCDCDDLGWSEAVAGPGVICGLHDNDGQIHCWGDQSVPIHTVPNTHLTELALGARHACGLDEARFPQCWGDGAQGQVQVPLTLGTRVARLELSENTSCVLTEQTNVPFGHNVLCWGELYGGQEPNLDLAAIPAGLYTSIALGSTHLCVGNELGAVCIDTLPESDLAPPGDLGAVTSLIGGEGYACALLQDSSLRCWGDEGFLAQAPQGMTFAEISGHRGLACGIFAEQVTCWGPHAAEIPAMVGAYEDLSVGLHHVCALRADTRALHCVGEANHGQHEPPLEPMVGLVASDRATCALRLSDRTPLCWGRVGELPEAPQVPMARLAMGNHHICGLQATGEPLCWGEDSFGQSSPPGGLTLRDLAVGERVSCGLRLDGSALCWGDTSGGLDQIPEGAFVQITMGQRFACARSALGAVQCWGDNESGQLFVPEGFAFTHIQATYQGAAGITQAGELRTWGRNLLRFGIPEGGFRDVAPYHWLDTRGSTTTVRTHHCALDAQGQMLCILGTGIYGDDQLLTGAFTEIAAGGTHTCAIRERDHIVVCTPHALTTAQ